METPSCSSGATIANCFLWGALVWSSDKGPKKSRIQTDLCKSAAQSRQYNMFYLFCFLMRLYNHFKFSVIFSAQSNISKSAQKMYLIKNACKSNFCRSTMWQQRKRFCTYGGDVDVADRFCPFWIRITTKYPTVRLALERAKMKRPKRSELPRLWHFLSLYGCESWTMQYKSIDAFWTSWQRFLRILWTARKTNK